MSKIILGNDTDVFSMEHKVKGNLEILFLCL